MKVITTIDRLILTGLLTAATLSISPFAQAQLPPIVDSHPQPGLTVKDSSNSLPSNNNNTNNNTNNNSNSSNNNSSNSGSNNNNNNNSSNNNSSNNNSSNNNNNNNNDSNNNSSEVITAAASTLKVTCQDLTTVVQKGDRQAIMVTWNYDGFGKEFTPQRRCQMVSERLQQVANLNGGTFKDLQIASGKVNSQPVICALQANSKKCNNKNLLFTLNPENARDPEAIMQKIFTFAQDGTSSLNESASTHPQKADLNLGNWEKKTFPQPSRFSNIKRKSANTGF